MSLPPRRVKSMSQLSGRITSVALAFLLLVAAVIAKAAQPPSDPPSCKAVRISDIGWTDVTSTSALFSVLVRQLGYDSQVTVLSVPVTYASMKNKDIDGFTAFRVISGRCFPLCFPSRHNRYTFTSKSV